MAKKKIPQIVKLIKNHPKFEINWAFNKIISYSQISTYETCPYQWKLKYKDKLKPFQQNINSLFGTCIHEVIQEYLEVMYNESIKKADLLDLNEIFEEKYRKYYQKYYKKNKNKHFSSPEELNEYFEDGLKILNEFKKKRGKYFSKRNCYLIGCEIPVMLPPLQKQSNIIFKGDLDIILYYPNSNRIEIIDLKTSTRGWRPQFEKKDELKNLQLVVYKKYLSKQFNIDEKNIEVKYLILKRKLYENTDFPQSRLQEHIPSQGRNKLKKAEQLVENFIKNNFEGNKIKEQKYKKKPSVWNCRFCPFSQNLTICGEGLRFKK